MKTMLVVILLAGLAGACSPEERVLVQKWNIPNIPAEMYNCPIVKTYPEVKTLTDSQVARLLVQLRSNNLTCKASLEGIRTFLADARNITR